MGESQGALLSGNALAANALNLNALNLNALNLNALNLNGLSAQNLAAIQDPGPNGALAREFLRYAASCALSSAASFDFSWTDSGGAVHHERYPGLLGVAPTWARGPLDELGQRMVSGCVAARVNYYRVPVLLSARSLRDPLKTLCSSQELVDYPDVEGAFWGNLFAAQPYLNACYNSATVTNSRAYQRDCAAGHLTTGGQTEECGVIRIAGSCDRVCQRLNGAGQYYPSCVDRPGHGSATTKEVITTALP
ncbi:hypothetical protein WMF30_22260 [Sorangium sp. So ce134]